ncbi:MAG: hypothetical protein K2P94_00785 [Rhodospirillaceae bacterium]|nr:hypothetical protein [Rhodospirillaceae bacterium]
MPEPVHMILDVAKVRPDPRAVSTWLTAYLGTRPLKAKHAALSALESQIAAFAAQEPRAVGLITRVIQKQRETLR